MKSTQTTYAGISFGATTCGNGTSAPIACSVSPFSGAAFMHNDVIDSALRTQAQDVPGSLPRGAPV